MMEFAYPFKAKARINKVLKAISAISACSVLKRKLSAISVSRISYQLMRYADATRTDQLK
ncbi:MAG: hypothetical protein F6K56_37695 [Moorea sp. SIO3G5]|nr:hypothetical protein [Moorena sp. SIO3G5]